MLRVVDYFAGLGGSSLGAERAGMKVVLCANHYGPAVDTLRHHHPSAQFVTQDLRQYDHALAPEHDVFIASPECKGHADAGNGARGRWGLDYSYHDASRATAWAVVDAIEANRPRYAVIENVVRFREWSKFDLWTESIRRDGYDLKVEDINAADLGVPQDRLRMFVVAWRHGEQEPDISVAARPEAEWTPASSIVDVEGGDRWAPVSSKSAAVQSRVANGRRNVGEVFISQHVTNHPGRSIDRPLPTITTRDQLCIVNGDLMRPLSWQEYLAAMGLPSDYHVATKSKKKLVLMAGNAVCPPVSEHVLTRVAEAAA